jgi:TolB protein
MDLAQRFPLLVPSRSRSLLYLAVSVLLLAGCGNSPTPVSQATPLPPTATTIPTATPTAVPTLMPSPTSTSSPTPTPPPTATPPTGANLIAFDTQRDGNGEIYLLDSASGQLINLTRHPADDRAPAWRPDGRAIAFESRRDGNWEIYVLDLTDASLSRLTDNLAFDGAPAWSPDGGEIAFESYRDGNLEIYAISSSGGPPRRLTDDPAGDYGPAWSPDGQEIAFTSWRAGNKDIYVMPAAGGQARNLTQHPADDENPAWMPDGSALAFVSWRNVDPATGNRNAEIYRLTLAEPLPQEATAERVTDNVWPDLDPAWDSEGRLVWAAYDPGPPFETYDPYRPGDYHLYRSGVQISERLTAADWDDRHPAPAPIQVASPDRLTGYLGPEPPSPTPMPTLAAGALVPVVEVPSILVGYTGQPIQVNERVAPSLVAWQQDLLQASGWDFLHDTLGTWRNIDQVRRKEMYTYDYGYLSWHKAGRALDLALEYKVDGADQMILVREDLGQNVYWRMFLRTEQQDGAQGEPLRDAPWRFWWHIVPETEPEAYAAGGKRLPIPAGYYVDVTAIAKRNGWARIACYAIEGDYHWQTDSNGTEYWHYERTDGLSWWDAMRQIYPSETMETHLSWQAGLQHAQSEEMMRSKGVPTPAP